MEFFFNHLFIIPPVNGRKIQGQRKPDWDIFFYVAILPVFQ